MKTGNVHLVLVAALALCAVPLACGNDEASPAANDAGSASGEGGTSGRGGSGGGIGPGGSGGEATGGNSGNASGGTSGGGTSSGGTSSGGTSGAGGANGTMGGAGGEGSAPEGGAAGESAGGEGGEGWQTETLEICKRICKKAEPLNCAEAATCVEDFRWTFFAYPWCREVSERMLDCLDRKATTNDFVCQFGRALPLITGPCGEELRAADEAYCII